MSKTSHLFHCQAALKQWRRAWDQIKHRDSRERTLQALEALATEQQSALIREQEQQQARKVAVMQAIILARVRRHAAKVLGELEVFTKP